MQDFGETPEGRAKLITITDGRDHVARLTDYGARLVQLWVPGRDGSPADIVLGHDSVAGYLAPPRTYFGATCGRYANRIAGGTFPLDGRTYQVDLNEGDNHLHGGSVGFDARLWRVTEARACSVTFALQSADGDMGYPAALDITACYAFTAPATLDITMTARSTGGPTIVNLVNHAYFNLAGQGSGTVEAQLLQIRADRYLPVDSALLPVGSPVAVDGTDLDFRTLRPIGSTPFDHNLCLDLTDDPVVFAVDPASGRALSLCTNQQGVQFYSSAYIPEGLTGKEGQRYGPLCGFTLETQVWPDAPNNAGFPSARLEDGEEYRHTMRYNFFVQS